MVEFPKKAGPYRMFTESGNTYFAVIELNRYKGGGMSIHVYQPLRFRSETFMSNSEEDIIRQFDPTSFEPLMLFDLNGERSDDLQAPRQMEAEPVTA
jgi:hypothetical protein